MKKHFLFIVLITFLITGFFTSCNSDKPTSEKSNTEDTALYDTIVGEDFTTDKVVQVAELDELMKDNDNLELVIEGKIESCCQKKGCWMKIDKGNGETMMVTFKDYGFFVPLESGGKTALMKGIAYYDTISVEMLKHYAEDAGKSEEEIALITEPELAISFEASGVKLK